MGTMGHPTGRSWRGRALRAGHVAASSGPPTGSIQRFLEASTMQSVQNPVLTAALPVQPLSVSGAYAHAPSVGTMPAVRSQLLDL